MGWLAQLVGTGLVLLGLIDIYMTVLYPRGGRGVVSVPLSRGIWCMFRLIARAIPKNWVDAQRLLVRNRLFSYMGPSLLVATVVVWVSLLTVGFALIFWPALGSQIQADKGSTPTDFITALYLSGYSLNFRYGRHYTPNKYLSLPDDPRGSPWFFCSYCNPDLLAVSI